MEKKTLTQFFTENGGDGETLLNSLQSSTENKKTKVTNSGPPKPTGPQGIAHLFYSALIALMIYFVALNEFGHSQLVD